MLWGCQFTFGCASGGRSEKPGHWLTFSWGCLFAQYCQTLGSCRHRYWFRRLWNKVTWCFKRLLSRECNFYLYVIFHLGANVPACITSWTTVDVSVSSASSPEVWNPGSAELQNSLGFNRAENLPLKQKEWGLESKKEWPSIWGTRIRASVKTD